MTLDQLMAFSVSDDHARQEQVWELLAHSWNKEPSFIRSKLTENTVRVSDKRALFVGIDAYTEAGGCVLRDLITADDGGRSEEHPSELQSLMRNPYAGFCLNKRKHKFASQSPVVSIRSSSSAWIQSKT